MPDNIITTEELFSLEEENQTTNLAEENNSITTEELFSLGKSTDPASSSTGSGSGDGSSVLLDRIEAGDFGEESKDEVEQLKQIPAYYDQERITPDFNIGYFPGPMRSDLLTKKGIPQRIREGDLMQPTDQVTNQVAEFYTIQENQFQKDKSRLLQIDNPEAKANQQKNNPEGLSQAELDAKNYGDMVFFANADFLTDNAPREGITTTRGGEELYNVVPLNDMYGVERPDSYWDQSDQLLEAREAHIDSLIETITKHLNEEGEDIDF